MTSRHHDHPSDPMCDQRVEIIVLGGAEPRRTTQDAQIPAREQARFDGLHELGKDRVVQFGHDQSDDADVWARAQRLRCITEFREHVQDTIARRGPDAVLAVHHPADRCIADAGKRRDVLKSDPHAPDCTCRLQEMEESLQFSCSTIVVSVM